MNIIGNIVTPSSSFYGIVCCENGKIVSIEKRDEFQQGADWILPGFIDLHLHGLGEFTAETPSGIEGMAKFALSCGTTGLCPTISCAPKDFILELLEVIRELSRKETGAKIIGSHIEGPWLDYNNRGGMREDMLRMPSIEEAKEFIEVAQESLKIVTVAPELPGAYEVIKYLAAHQVVVSAGHTGCPPSRYEEAVEAGISQFCHLFDSYDLPEDEFGVRKPALTDLALIDSRVNKELILDGLHVPAELVKLARFAAGVDSLIGITDAMQGAGLEEGHFEDMGLKYVIKSGDLARRESDGQIVGSALTMNRAFFNLLNKFGFSPVEAVKLLATNPARVLGIDKITGSIQIGLQGDIAVLAQDSLTVVACYLNGELVYKATLP